MARAKKGKLYCICREPNDKNKPMVRCDDCKQWFHISCLVAARVHLDLDVDGDLLPNAAAVCFSCSMKKSAQQPQQPLQQQSQRSAVQQPILPPPPPPPPLLFSKSKSKPAATPRLPANKPAAKPKRKQPADETSDDYDDNANATSTTKNRKIADGPIHSKRVPVPKKK